MTQETIINIAMWIAAFALLVILVVVACCAIWFVIRTAWEYISPSDKEEEPDDVYDPTPQRLNECERKIKLLEEFKASLATNGIIIDGVVYAYKKAKLETKDGTICTTCALNAICDNMKETITCSVFKGSDEDGCHFER